MRYRTHTNSIYSTLRTRSNPEVFVRGAADDRRPCFSRKLGWFPCPRDYGCTDLGCGKSLLQYLWSETQPRATFASCDEISESVACSKGGRLNVCAGQILDAKSGKMLVEHEELSTSHVKYLFTPDGLQLLVGAEESFMNWMRRPGNLCEPSPGHGASLPQIFTLTEKHF